MSKAAKTERRPRKPRKCPCCGLPNELEYAPDPYQSDVNGDDTPVWKCADCRDQSAMDI